MKHIFKVIALVVISLIVGLIIIVSKAEAGGPWSNQYCDVKVTQF
jgi:lipopolysaccharide/colanic/teichoic acid biosynthesis glycosyltransferase